VASKNRFVRDPEGCFPGAASEGGEREGGKRNPGNCRPVSSVQVVCRILSIRKTRHESRHYSGIMRTKERRRERAFRPGGLSTRVGPRTSISQTSFPSRLLSLRGWAPSFTPKIEGQKLSQPEAATNTTQRPQAIWRGCRARLLHSNSAGEKEAFPWEGGREQNFALVGNL